MTKKQKNRKIISQNIRNKNLNRRYTSLIKFLLKNLKSKISILKKQNFISNIDQNEIMSLERKIESLFDKAAKKNVLHLNNSSRKKSRLRRFIRKELLLASK